MTSLKDGEVKVLLSRDGRAISNVRPVYIGLLGMCLKSNSRAIHKHEHIDVEIYLQQSHQRKHCSLKAVVTQLSGTFAGFTFLDTKAKDYDELCDIVATRQAINHGMTDGDDRWHRKTA